MIDPEIERELACIRGLLTREMQCFRELTEQRDETRMEALRVALAANEKRLDAMNEIRQALSDQSGRMVTRQESESAIDVVAERLEQNRVSLETRLEVVTKPLAERMEQNRVSMEARIESITRPKWTLMASLFSICLVLITGAWVLTGLKVDASVAPIALLLEQVKTQVGLDTERLHTLENVTAGSSQADATSRTDRNQLNERVRGLESNLSASQAERRSQYAVMQAKLVEIETQFCAGDIVRNLLHANDMRVQSLLWSKVNPGEHMPTDNAFYPVICNRNTNEQAP
jgi:hypothetical protein